MGNVLGFTDQEKFDCYMLTAGVMTFGGIEFKTKGRDDQAECEHIGPDTYPGKAAALCGVDAFAMIKAFCKPRIKVGTEWVIKGQTCEQSTNAVGGIARAIFDRVFKWLIEKCNDTLIDASLKKANFCAVLDIAGLKYLSTTDLSKSPSTLSMRSFSNSSIITCLLLSKRNMLRKGLIGKWLTLEWTWLQPSSCLRNQWEFGQFWKKNPFSQKQQIKALKRS